MHIIMKVWLEGSRGSMVQVLLYCLLTISLVHSAAYRNLCHKQYYKWPQCINHPDGYGCECGPGYIWNTHMCVALGVDSYFEFSNAKGQVQYVLLQNKPFPELDTFTISMWLKPRLPMRPVKNTILSYSAFPERDTIKMIAGPTLNMKVHSFHAKTNVQLKSTQWTHVVWTWAWKNGFWDWQIYINGTLNTGGRFEDKGKEKVPGLGELVLGQASREPNTEDSFNKTEAFTGEMSFVNIWSYVLDRQQIMRVYEDCFYMECGDAIEWTDFREGTRGSLKVRWPANIQEHRMPCFSEPDTFITCDRYCSETIGAQCNAEIVENIKWRRTKADENATMPCPRQPDANATTAFAVRKCRRTGEYDGTWEAPNLRDCVSKEEYDMKFQIRNVVHLRPINGSAVLHMAGKLKNRTVTQRYDNVNDIATVIDALEMLTYGQNETLETLLESTGSNTYGLDRERDKERYPTFNNTVLFSQKITSIMDTLIQEKNEGSWHAQNPQGVEGDQFLKASSHLLDVLARSLQFHIGRGDIEWSKAEIVQARRKLAFVVKMYNTDNLRDINFPYQGARKRLKLVKVEDFLRLPHEIITNSNGTEMPDRMLISTARLDMAKVVPNHNLKKKSKEDNVNSALFALHFHQLNEEQVTELNNMSIPVVLKFQYLDNFNISNPECVMLDHSTRKTTWNWTRSGCKLIKNNTKFAWCNCYKPGIFAVLTDMYDDNWDPGEEPLILMEVPSYIGCSLSALMCLFSALMLVYLRTSSKVSHLHKHFAVAIICGQLSFMLGIDRLEHPVLCHVCAITFHYFFLATFSWLMNEAFNLYIVITYAAHSHGEHTEGGSQWRYYILGWVLPGVLVGAFVGAHSDDYYAPDMCWIAWQYVWLFLGPAVGIISVTVLVMIFTAKEHHESSYSKNEKTNNQIVIYSKALWTQIILLTICWSFAFLSIKMRGVIIKWIYALFNTIQGAFFVVFYFLLNDEVRTVYQATVKKNSMNKMGYDYSPAESQDEDDEGMELATRMHGSQETETIPDTAEPSSSRTPTKRRRSSSGGSRRKIKCGIETSDDDTNDESTAELDDGVEGEHLDGDDEDEGECDVIMTTTV